MADQQLSRRQVLGSIAGLAAAPAFGSAALAQEPVALSIPNDPDVRDVFDDYDIIQENGYTKIIMDHVPSDREGAGTLDVTIIRDFLNIEARRNGTLEPIIITDYAYDGPEEMYATTAQQTGYQDELFEKVLPLAAQDSQRPIVHIRASAYGTRGSELTTLHGGSLINDLESNRLGPNGAKADVAGGIALPYFNTKLGNDVLYDAAFNWYRGHSAPDIQRTLGARILTVVDQQNAVLTARLEL